MHRCALFATKNSVRACIPLPESSLQGTCTFLIISPSRAGLGLELAAEVLRNPSLLDLLVSFLYTAVHGGRVGLMYPSSVQRAQADGTVRSFVISDIMNDNGSSPSSTNGTVTGSSATSSTADASMNSPVSNNEFPAERMNLTLLKEVLDKMPSIACLQAWARGEEASCEADTNSVEPHLGSAYPLDAETINGGSTSNTYKSVRDNIEHNRVDSLNSPSEERASDRCMRERSGTLLRRKLDEVRCVFMLDYAPMDVPTMPLSIFHSVNIFY